MAAECKPSTHILALVKQAEIPTPSGDVLKRLAGIAVQVEELLAADHDAHRPAEALRPGYRTADAGGGAA